MAVLSVRAPVGRCPVDDVCMSVVPKAELLYGVEVSSRRAQDAAALAAFLPYVETVDLDEGAALHYAEIRADLKRRGIMIGANDLCIAALARTIEFTLVTNNTETVRDIVARLTGQGTVPPSVNVTAGKGLLHQHVA